MLKLLRKYNKWILVIGGAMLMVAFLMPQMLQELGRGVGSHTTVVRVNGHRISQVDAQTGHIEVGMLRELGFLNRKQSDDWWLLATYEAEQAGVVGGLQSGRDAMNDVVDQIAQQAYFQAMYQQQRQSQPPDMAKIRENARLLMENRVAGVARSARVAPDEVYLALAKLKGIERLDSAYREGMARISDRREILAGKDRLDEAKVDWLFIAGDRLLGVPAPTDEALAAQFDRFKAVKQGQGEFGIGYTLPPRVKIEWMKLDRDAWGELVSVSLLEVSNRYLRENKSNPNATASGPEFEAARPAIEAAIRKETLDKAMGEAVKVVRAEIAKPAVRLERAGDYLVLPDDWDQRRPDFNKIRDLVAARVNADAGLAIPAPSVTVRAATWLTDRDLSQVPEIGQAFAKRGNSTLPVSQLVLATKELSDTPSPLGLQARVPFGPIEDGAGNQYFITVLDTRRESPPDSWTEVRDELVKDNRKLEGFKTLEKDAEAYYRLATTDGLDAVAKAFLPSPVVKLEDAPAGSVTVQHAITVTRQNATGELNSEPIRKAIVDAAIRWDPTVSMDLFDVGMRTLALPIPEHLGLAVVKVTGYTPLTNEKLRKEDKSLASQLRNDAFKDLKDSPYMTLARLKERLKADFPGRKDKPGEQPEAEDKTEADAGM